MLIAFIVYAQNEDEAYAHAEKLVNELCSVDIFDYYLSLDDKDAQWSLPRVMRADSPEGKRLIDQLMNATWREFKEHITILRNLFEVFSDEEIFEEKPSELASLALSIKNDKRLEDRLSGASYYLHSCSRYACSHASYLFNHDGFPIMNRKALNSALSKWRDLFEEQGEENPFADLNVYVVPFDVHY